MKVVFVLLICAAFVTALGVKEDNLRDERKMAQEKTSDGSKQKIPEHMATPPRHVEQIKGKPNEGGKETEEPGEKDPREGRHHRVEEAEGTLRAQRRDQRIFLALYSTTSIKRVATTTITRLSTCLSTSTTPCTGRKKKSVSLLEKGNWSAPWDWQLESSLPEYVPVQEEDQGRAARDVEGVEVVRESVEDVAAKDNKSGRRLTIVTSSISILTVTSTSYKAGTTVIASALCAAPGLVQQCFGK